MSVIDEIAAERQRQIDVEGCTSNHDDQYGNAQLARAAAAYCLNLSADTYREGATGFREAAKHAWPWAWEWWKPKNPRRDLIRAAALIVAEIERLDRAALQSQKS